MWRQKLNFGIYFLKYTFKICIHQKIIKCSIQNWCYQAQFSDGTIYTLKFPQLLRLKLSSELYILPIVCDSQIMVMKIYILWDITTCISLEANRRFWRTRCLHLGAWRNGLQVSQKRRITFTNLHGIISQKHWPINWGSLRYQDETIQGTRKEIFMTTMTFSLLKVAVWNWMFPAMSKDGVSIRWVPGSRDVDSNSISTLLPSRKFHLTFFK
jgi:hypothetical protein